MDERQKLIDKVISDLNKQFGDGCVKTLENKLDEGEIHGFIPTNNLALNYVIGRRGLPLGRVSEIAGRPGSGKSSIVASIIGAAQKSGAVCILNDTEHSYSPDWSRRFQVNPETLILLEPPNLEKVFDYTTSAVKQIREEQSEIPVFIAVDSVSASPTSAELEQEDSSASKQRAEHAKIISQGLRKLTNLIWDQNVSLLFVSQLKDNPGGGYGSTKSKLGGSAIEFHSGLQLEVSRTSFKKEKEKTIGITIQVKCIKNKFVPPFRVRTMILYYEEGFKPKEILLDFMADDDVGLIKEKMGWYEWEGSKYRSYDIVDKISDDTFELVYEKLGIPK